MSGYLSELTTHWRPLLAATIGIGTGMSTAGTITSVLAPSLIEGNGWASSDFAAVGMLGLFSTLAFPFIGRLADVLGVRRTALIGQVTLPLSYLAYATIMGGSLAIYMAIFVVQSILCVTTTATVYTRLAVQYFVKARGLALAIVVSGSAIFGAIGGPILNSYVEANGWEATYLALAAFAVIAAVVVFLLIPPDAGRVGSSAPKRRARDDYPMIFRSPAFWILALVMLLCNLPATLILVQLKLLVEANGVSGPDASIMFTALSVGMLTGRFLTGLALDRFEPYLVAFITLGLPSFGIYLIASSLDALPILTFAVFCLGFAFGAEGDIVAFLVAKRFGLEVYSSVMGLLTAIMSLSTSLGAGLLSLTLARTGGYDLFLVISGTAVIVGATLLLFLRRGNRPAAPA
jgi:MFS family permease